MWHRMREMMVNLNFTTLSSGRVVPGVPLRRFVFQARYDLGLSNVSQGGGDIKNGGWGITLGYGFPIR